MPYDWTTGHCKDCGKFVRDGEGIQEQVGDGEILRFCVKCHTKRCNSPVSVAVDHAGTAEEAGPAGDAHAIAG